jgi:hypothetical protein
LLLQINGIDVNGLSHHEVRKMFVNSEENIVAELRNLNNYKTNCKLKEPLVVLEMPRRNSVTSPVKSATSSPSNSIGSRRRTSIGVQTDNLSVIDVDSYEPEEHLVVEQYLPSETDVEVSFPPKILYYKKLTKTLNPGIHPASQEKQDGLND